MSGQRVARVFVGRSNDFPLHTVTVVRTDSMPFGERDREIGIYRSSDGSLRAFRNFCPHRGAPVCQGEVRGTMLPSEPDVLDYGLEGRVLRCP